MVKQKQLRIAFLFVTSVLSMFVIWWYWQSPYRILYRFLKALDIGDIKTLYDLTPDYERKYVKININKIRLTYTKYLKPYFLEKYHLIRIQKAFKSGRETSFFLLYQDNEGKLKATVISVVKPLGENRWKVPFSYFVYCVTKTLYGVDRVFEIMHQIGYPVIADPQGAIIQRSCNP